MNTEAFEIMENGLQLIEKNLFYMENIFKILYYGASFAIILFSFWLVKFIFWDMFFKSI